MPVKSREILIDRSDVLTAKQRAAGYRVLVERRGVSIIVGLFFGAEDPDWMERRKDDDAWVGRVWVSRAAGPFDENKVFVENADVEEEHRGQGQGFGTLLYNLAISYAYRDLGARRVIGQDPSEYARGVHRKLAKLYETRFRTRYVSRKDGNLSGVQYSYPIKAMPKARLQRSKLPKSRHRRVPEP